jgi:hypothetical protein
MLGRGSRTRGVCEGVMFTIGSEKASQTMRRLKDASILKISELEPLLKNLEPRAYEKQLIVKLEQWK